jgi:hypothetical protein
VCRYGRPEETASRTCLRKDNDSVKKRRHIGCNYMTGYGDDLFSATKSNGDVSELRGHNFWYSFKYPTKTQESFDSKAVADRLLVGLQRSMDRRKMIEDEHPDMTMKQSGCGRVHSVAYAYTNVNEVRVTIFDFH